MAETDICNYLYIADKCETGAGLVYEWMIKETDEKKKVCWKVGQLQNLVIHIYIYIYIYIYILIGKHELSWSRKECSKKVTSRKKSVEK